MDTKNGISQELINEIRMNADIVDVISSYIPLTKKGKNFFGVCPFHSDHSPSMSVSSEKQMYKCFSCGAAGNVYKFIMDYEHVGFMEALKMVSIKAGIDINVGNIKTDKPKNKELYDIYNISQMFYQNNINTSNGHEAKEYLKKRQINDEIIKEFGIGLSLKNNSMLYNILKSKGYSNNNLIKSGLINQNEYGFNDVYYNRIMFPLYDITGNIVGYSGRIYNSDDTAKYVNTKETPIFKKGEILYNYHRAKNESRLKNQIIIVEGFMDVIRAYSVGIKNVVATMGTAITDVQALHMKRLAKDIILCFDGDKAGAKATSSCIEELIKIGVTPKIVRLEDNLDPDEYILKYGKDRFLLKLDNPINIMDFKLSYLKEDKDLNNNVEVANYLNKVLIEVSKIDDAILKNLTLKKVSTEYDIDYNVLSDKLNQLEEDKKSVNVKELEKKKPVQKLNKYIKAEQELLYYMLDNVEVVKMYEKKVTYMPTGRYRSLARDIDYFYKQYNYVSSADIMTMISDSEESLKTISEILNLDLKDSYTIEQIDDYINIIKEYTLKSETKRLKDLMRTEIDPLKKAEIAQKIVELRIQIEAKR